MLASTVIRNSSVYNASELFATYKAHTGKVVSPQTAQTIADAIREMYRADGYSRPGFTVADDGQQSGIVRIDLTEASIAEVRFQGDSGPYRQKLEALFSEVASGQSLRPVDIRNAVQRARQYPGLQLGIATTPDVQGNGRFLLDVDTEFSRFAGSVTVNNRGTKQIGRNLAFARITSNGLFGGENSLGLFLGSAENPDNYASGGLFMQSALAGSSTALLQGSLMSVQVESSGAIVDQERERFLLKVSSPLPDWGDRKLKVWAALDLDNIDVSVDGVANRAERLRSLQSGLTMSWRDGARQHLLSADVEAGLDGLGARQQNVGSTAEPLRNDFLILRLHLVSLKSFGDDWTLRNDAWAQHSPHQLPSIRQFKVGGGRIGRGFDAAAVSGERGLASKFELRRRLADDVPLADQVDAYAFYDIGATWREDTSGRESAASSGLGLSIRSRRVSGYFELARPLTHADADGNKELGLFVELTSRFD